jgi:hypothetical protein
MSAKGSFCSARYKNRLHDINNNPDLHAGLAKVITIYYTIKLDKLIRSQTVRGAWKRIK